MADFDSCWTMYFFVVHFQNCTMSMCLRPRFLWTYVQQFVGLMYLITIHIHAGKLVTSLGSVAKLVCGPKNSSESNDTKKKSVSKLHTRLSLEIP